jgi:hypothetical protein
VGRTLLTARTVQRVLLPAGCLSFFAGMLLAAVPYYAGQSIDLRRAVLSSLSSHGDNPHGYLAADLGVMICAILLTPVALWFFRVLRQVHRGLAAIGALLFDAGLMASIAIGLMGPFEQGFSPLHIDLAYATFIFMAAGMLILLGLAVRHAWQAGGGRVLLVAEILLTCLLILLFYLLAGESNPNGNFFNDKSWFRSLALSEWLLCGVNVGYLLLLVNAAAAMGERVAAKNR